MVMDLIYVISRNFRLKPTCFGGLPHRFSGEEYLPANAGDERLIPGSGRSPREGHGNPLQYSCLENPTDRGAWWATLDGVAKVLGTT